MKRRMLIRDGWVIEEKDKPGLEVKRRVRMRRNENDELIETKEEVNRHGRPRRRDR